MKTIPISTLSLSFSPRASVALLQDQLRDAQKEVVTGRFADIGQSLGVRSGQTISMRADLLATERTMESNSLILTRFDTMYAALGSIATQAEKLRDSLLANGTSDIGMRTTVEEAARGLNQFTAAMNVSSGSRYLFSGATTDRPAIAFSNGAGAANDYFDGSTARDAVGAAFQTAFGVSSDDAAGVKSIDETALSTFLGGDFSTLFEVPTAPATDNWGQWSQADGAPVLNTISEGERVNTSFGADSPAFRNIAKAYVMLADLGGADLNEGARGKLVENALSTLGEGLTQLTALRAELGASQGRVETVQDTLKSRKTVISISIGSFEEVDPYEASTRVTTLMNQLEASYALTARISRLSLLNYL